MDHHLQHGPITKLAQALEVSDEARVITVGAPPYKIVHTNKGAPPPPHACGALCARSSHPAQEEGARRARR